MIAISARRAVASIFGAYAGLLGMQHGYFETLQGNVAPKGMLINAIAPQASNMWQGGEPALTIIPNFLVTGFLSIIFGILVVMWSTGFIQRKKGSVVLTVL
jgi:hypothetical protein